MIQESIIQQLESYYNMFVNISVPSMLDFATDTLFQRVKSIPYCAEVLERVTTIHSYNSEEIENVNIDEKGWPREGFSLLPIITERGIKQYVAYCIQYHQYLKDNGKIDYIDYVPWLTNNTGKGHDCFTEEQNFRNGFVRPIIDFLISELKKDSFVLYILNRYKSRIERFGINYKDKDTEESELKLHKKLCKFLFDQGLDADLFYSPNTGNAIPDFIFSNIEGSKYIVEVKYIKQNETRQISIIRDGISQLRQYMHQNITPYGCLYVFTEKEERYFSCNEHEIITVYIGNKRASTIRFNEVNID